MLNSGRMALRLTAGGVMFSLIAFAAWADNLCGAGPGTAPVKERAQLTEPRIKPLTESEWSAELQRFLSNYKLPDGRYPNFLTTLANHPILFYKLNEFTARESSLSAREREILILRTGWLRRSDFELGWHTKYGKAAGLSEEEIGRIADGPTAPGWSPFEATLLTAADELHCDAFISDATWNALATHYNQRQLMDVVFTVGQYDMLAMYLKSLGVQLDEGVPHFPKKQR